MLSKAIDCSIVAVLLLLSTGIHTNSAALTSGSCTSDSDSGLWMQFKSAFSPGSQSYISKENYTTNTYYMTSGRAMPLIIVDILTNDPISGTAVLQTVESGYMLGVQSAPSVLFSGAVVAVSHGRAVFSALTPTACLVTAPTPTLHTLVFSLRSESGLFLNVPTLSITVACVGDISARTASYLNFGTVGFITPANRNRFIPPAIVIPDFTVSAYTLLGFPDDGSATQSSIQVSMSNGTVSLSSFARAADNVFTISGLRFVPANAAVAQTLLTISTVTQTGNIPLPALRTVLLLESAVIPNRFMRFDSSSGASRISNNGQALSAVESVALPLIAIRFYDSLLNFDPSGSGIIVTATCAEAALTGANAVVQSGVAKFTSLAFAPGSAPLQFAVLTFTASGAASRVTEVLYSGDVTVTSSPLYASSLQFASSSGMSVAPITVAVDAGAFTLPNILVLVLDSALELDTTANNIQLQLQLSAGVSASLTSGGVASVTNGLASFSSIVCSGGTEGLTFTVCVTDQNGGLSKLCTGTVTLASPSTSPEADLQACVASTSAACKYSLAFQAPQVSFIYEEGQPLIATVAVPLPIIRIALRNAFGELSTGLSASRVPILVAYTGTTPEEELWLSAEGRLGTWKHTYYSFSCLRFERVPTGYVRLRFAAVQDVDEFLSYAAIGPLVTGHVDVYHRRTSAVGLRFSSSNLVFSSPATPSTAVVNVVLPTIRVEVVDSEYNLDPSVNGVTIQCVTSSGALHVDGSLEVVAGGVATFQLLTFRASGVEPTLSFVAQRTALPVGGKELRTGAIVVTAAPIPATELQFVQTIDALNNATQSDSTFVFASFGETLLRVAITIADSAHVVSSTAARTVAIAQTSAEGSLAASQTIVVAQGVAALALFQASFLAYQAGYDRAPIYLKYTVTGGSSAFLIGSSLWLGPIFIASQMDLDTCASLYKAPIVTLLFRQPYEQFNVTAAIAEVATRLSLSLDKAVADSTLALPPATVLELLALSPSSRLLPLSVAATTSADAVTLTRWVGTKLVLLFANQHAFLASASSMLDQRTSRQLAASIVAYRPTCTPQTGSSAFSYSGGYTVQSSVYVFDDATCSVALFQRALLLAENCSVVGFMSACECYGIYAMTPYGSACSGLPELAATFTGLCASTLLGCSGASVALACQDFAPPEPVSKLVYLALITLVVIPCAVVAYCCFRRVTGSKVLMNSERQREQSLHNKSLDEVVSDLKKKVTRVL